MAAATLALTALAAGSAMAAAEPVAKPGGDKEILVNADNQFAMDLYGKLQVKPGNLFFSPESIAMALQMTSAGAGGATAREMAKVLHTPSEGTVGIGIAKDETGLQGDARQIPVLWPAPRLSAANGALMADLKGAGKRPYELAIANALWGQKGYGFLPEFTGLLKTSYGAGLEEVDFAKDAEGSRKTINTWVEKQTNEKIKDLMPQGSIDAMTRLVLTNAIYFKGDWVKPFEKAATSDQDFFLAADKKVKTPLMYQKGDYKYLDSPELLGLEMPYAGDELSMVVLLPKKVDGLAVLEKDLTAEKVTGWIGKLAKRHNVEVTLPKFKLNTEFQLKDTLAAMGMPTAFVPGKADFAGMNGGKEPLFISAVVHKAFVDVNEQGTEAAAATGIGIRTMAMPVDLPIFRADHPFIFLIRDVKSGVILFLGRVADPTK
jgi:serpin B